MITTSVYNPESSRMTAHACAVEVAVNKVEHVTICCFNLYSLCHSGDFFSSISRRKNLLKISQKCFAPLGQMEQCSIYISREKGQKKNVAFRRNLKIQKFILTCSYKFSIGYFKFLQSVKEKRMVRMKNISLLSRGTKQHNFVNRTAICKIQKSDTSRICHKCEKHFFSSDTRKL